MARAGAPRRQSNGAWSGSDRAAPERVRSIRPQEAPILIAELNAVDRLGYLAAGLNHNARQYHSDDSDCDGDLGRRRTALTLQESLQEANCPPHVQSPAYRCHITTGLLKPSSVTGDAPRIDTGRGVPSALVMRLRRPPFFIAHLGRAGART